MKVVDILCMQYIYWATAIIISNDKVVYDYSTIYRRQKHAAEYFTPHPLSNGHAKPAEIGSSTERGRESINHK